VELIVVLTVIALLLALLLPAVQRVRASARLLACRSHLHQIGIAAHSYLESHRRFPGGYYAAPGGCLYALLPYVEQSAVFIRAEGIADSAAKAESIPVLPIYLCPDDPTNKPSDVASYATNKGLLKAVGAVRGFVFEPPIRSAEITDGLSNTAFVSEQVTNSWRPSYLLFESAPPLWRSVDELQELASACAASSGTMAPRSVGGQSARVLSISGGYNHLLPPNSPICAFTPYPADVQPPVSGHSQGVNVLCADGSVRFASNSIDRRVWWALGTIDSGENIGAPP
jgi:type II secretory pathway pseudopilin PulG